MKRRRLTIAQKKALLDHARFWSIHAGHWSVLLAFVAVSLSILYTFWGNDAAFAAVVLGH
jgi:hypothetical protein